MKIYTAHFYGHYDSRGGATLILNAPSDGAALTYYVQRAFATTPDDEWYDDYIRNLEEELMRTVIVKWYGRGQIPEVDLLYGDNHDILTRALCHKSRVEPDHHGDLEADDYDDILEIWIGPKADLPPAPKGYVLAEMEHWGEDAYGIIINHFNESHLL